MRIVGLALVAAGCAAAQVSVGVAAGISYAEGAVTIDGEKTAFAATRWTELPNGSIVRTAPGGRAELMLSACAALHLDESSEARILSNRLEDTRVELVAGAAMVRVDGVPRETRATVVVQGAEAPLSTHGLYRFEASPPRVKVYEGKVGGVSAGRTAALVGGGAPQKFKADPTEDALGRWSDSREFTLLRESGYNAAAERSWEEAMRRFRAREARGLERPGARPPESPKNRLRLCGAQ